MKVTSITGAPQVRKKIMNIPIGDVRIDADYEKNVCAFYSLPVSYLKYHRRIEAHDSDPSTEYVADKKDEVIDRSVRCSFFCTLFIAGTYINGFLLLLLLLIIIVMWGVTAAVSVTVVVVSVVVLALRHG